MPNELESKFYFDQDEKSNADQPQSDEKTEVIASSTEYIDTVFKEFQDLVDRHHELIDEQKVAEYSNLILEIQDLKEMLEYYKENKQEPDEKLCMTAKVLAEKIQPVLDQINSLITDIGQAREKLTSSEYIKKKFANLASNKVNGIDLNIRRDVADRLSNDVNIILGYSDKLNGAIRIIRSVGKFQELYGSFEKRFNEDNSLAVIRREEFGDSKNYFWNGVNAVKSVESESKNMDISISIFESIEFVNQLKETVENKKSILENNGNIAYGRDSHRESLYKFKINNTGSILKYTGLYLENKNAEVPYSKNKELVGEALKNEYFVDTDNIDNYRSQDNLNELNKEELYKKIVIDDLDKSKNPWQHEFLDKIQARGLMPVDFNTR